jgi:hypothetical protein
VAPKIEDKKVLTSSNLSLHLQLALSNFIRKFAEVVRNEHFLAGLLLLAALLFFYRDVAFGGHTFLVQDGYATMPGGGPYNYPATKLTDGQRIFPLLDPAAVSAVNQPYNRWAGSVLRRGELPLWNWHTGLGQPFLSDGSSGALEPIQLFFYFLPDRWWPVTTDLQVLLRFFLAGFFTYLFVRQLGLRFFPAVFAGAGFMLTGFLVDYGNHPQLRPEAFIPLLFYSYERLVQKSRVITFSLCALAVAWVIVAAMPEDGFLDVFAANCWYLYRGFWKSFDAKFGRKVLARLASNLLIANLLGLALSAFFLLPLAENINESLHIHYDIGVATFYPPAALLSFFFPSQATSDFPVPHYYTTPLILGLLALLTLPKNRDYRRYLLFFAVFYLVVVLKSHDFPLLPTLGVLPIFKQVLLIKYFAPILSLFLIVMAAFGIEAIMNKQVLLSRFWLVVLALIALIIGLVLGFDLLSKLEFEKLKKDSLILGEVVLAILFVIVLTRYLKLSQATYAIYLLLILVVAEPEFRASGAVRPLRYDTYTVPPFISEVLQRDPSVNRIFGLQAIVYPEAATPYGLDDIRFNVAASSERRFLFNTQFLAPSKAMIARLLKPGEAVSQAIVPSMVKTFSSWSSIRIGEKNIPDVAEFTVRVSTLTGLEKPFYYSKFFDLLNTRYILTTKDNPPFNSFRLLDNLEGDQPVITRLNLNGDNRNALSLSSPLVVPVLVPSGHSNLQFALTPDPALCNQTSADNGSIYRVLLTDGKGQHEIFRQIISGATRSQCAWLDQTVDLSPWSGQRITLTLSSEGGKGYWSEPIINLPPEPNPWQRGSEHFELIYDKEVQIYRNNYAYPRAFVVHQVEQAANVNEAISRMIRPNFDPATSAVVEGQLPTNAGFGAASGTALPPSSVQIGNRNTNALQMQTTLEKAGLLVISNSYNQNLKAYVDGVATPVLPVDGFLSGIYLNAGTHNIEFAYEPTSFTIGLLISFGALLVLAGGALLALIKSRRLKV